MRSIYKTGNIFGKINKENIDSYIFSIEKERLDTMLEELKTFMAVVEQESFTKAAEAVKLSQPSVSIHIRNLENYFKTKLVSRSVKQKSIVITEEGYLLYKRSKEILTLLDTTKEELKNISSTVKGHIKIGASLTIGEYFLPDFLSEFCRVYEDVEIEVAVENTSIICEKVKNLNMDFGLIEGIPSSFDFFQDYFFQDTMVLMVSYDHALTKLPFSYNNLQNLRWITREQGSGTREYLNMFLTKNKIIPKSIIVLGSNYAVKEAVKNGLGITFISSYVAKTAENKKEVSLLDIGEENKRYYSYIFSKEISQSKVAKVFIEELKKYSNQY